MNKSLLCLCRVLCRLLNLSHDNLTVVCLLQEKEHPRVLIPELCRLFYQLGWVTGTGGGISLRRGFVCRLISCILWRIRNAQFLLLNHLTVIMSPSLKDNWHTFVLFFCLHRHSCQKLNAIVEIFFFFENICMLTEVRWGCCEVRCIGFNNVCKSRVETEGHSLSIMKQNSDWRLWQVITNIFELCCFGPQL